MNACLYWHQELRDSDPLSCFGATFVLTFKPEHLQPQRRLTPIGSNTSSLMGRVMEPRLRYQHISIRTVNLLTPLYRCFRTYVNRSERPIRLHLQGFAQLCLLFDNVSSSKSCFGASYSVKFKELLWRELFWRQLFGQVKRAVLARAIWSSLQSCFGATSYSVKSNELFWRELFGRVQHAVWRELFDQYLRGRAFLVAGETSRRERQRPTICCHQVLFFPLKSTE